MNERKYTEFDSAGYPHKVSEPTTLPAPNSLSIRLCLNAAINLCLSERNRWREGDKEYVHWDSTAAILQGHALALAVRAEVPEVAPSPQGEPPTLAKNKSTPEHKAFWDHIEETAEQVRHWPKWMGGRGVEPLVCAVCNRPLLDNRVHKD